MYAGPVAGMSGSDRVGHQHLHRLADELVPSVPEQPLGLGVDQGDPPVPLDAHHRVRRRLEQTAEPGAGRCRLVTSLVTVATPMIEPARSVTGDMVSVTSTIVPSLRIRRVWCCSTRSPRATAASVRVSSTRSARGMSSST